MDISAFQRISYLFRNTDISIRNRDIFKIQIALLELEISLCPLLQISQREIGISIFKIQIISIIISNISMSYRNKYICI